MPIKIMKGLARLIDLVTQVSGKDRSKEACTLVSGYLTNSDEEMADTFCCALLDVLPAEQNSNLLTRLQLLGTYWAMALVRLGFPSLDPAEIRPRPIVRSFRLRSHMEARLIRQGLYGHCELFPVLDDRFWAFSTVPGLVRRYASSARTQYDSCFLEPVLIAGTVKASLRSNLIARYQRELSAKQRQAFKIRLGSALDHGFKQPWSPALNSQQKSVGIDILLTEGLANAGPLGISTLVSRIKPKQIIGVDENPGFLCGLTDNSHFRRSATTASQDLGGKASY